MHSKCHVLGADILKMVGSQNAGDIETGLIRDKFHFGHIEFKVFTLGHLSLSV